jgi:hypothetical protein
MLPYLLTGRADGMPEVATAAADALDALAAAYETEEALNAFLNQTAQLTSALPAWLGEPPRLGARIVVRECLSALLPACARELRSCVDCVRRRAILLLTELLRHAEGGVGRHAVAGMLPLLVRAASSDVDPHVMAAARHCCELVRFFTPVDLWQPLFEGMSFQLAHD